MLWIVVVAFDSSAAAVAEEASVDLWIGWRIEAEEVSPQLAINNNNKKRIMAWVGVSWVVAAVLVVRPLASWEPQ